MEISKSHFNKKRVTKNTLFLYSRMLIIMVVQFYTIRVTLKVLGDVDYGIANLIAGLANIFTFITHTMTSASQRFIAYGIGKGDREQLKKTTISILSFFLSIGVILLLLLEAIGLYAIPNILNIPENKIYASIIIYQFTLINLFLSLGTMTYNSLIIAHEDMSIYAYTSLLEVILKLIIIFLLTTIPIDKLIMYVFLYMCVQFMVSGIYIYYCLRNYEEAPKSIAFDKETIKEVVPYMSWNLLGGLSWMLCTQGLTILINIFFGPVANTAKAIADRVQSAVTGFSSSFMMASEPQIIKTYANNEIESMHKIIFFSTNYSFYLLLLFSLPVIFNTNEILTLWLGKTDITTERMLQILLFFSMSSAFEHPINQAIRATGNIKKYQIQTAFLTLCVIPLSFVFFELGFSSYYGHFALCIIYGITLFLRIYFLKKQIGISYQEYFYKALLRPISCFSLLVIICHIIKSSIKLAPLQSVGLSTFLIMLSSIIIITFFGINSSDKKAIFSHIKNHFKGRSIN